VAINLVEFGRATRSSFRQALISAVIVISLLLFAMWRRAAPMLLVMTPLMLSSVLTVAAMVLVDIPFNFGNVIVIPLLLGIGVDSGIHLVHRAELLRGSDDDLMDSTTARAVFYSALTTTISFGTLAFSSHRGLASLGMVLSIGMLLTVFSNLIFLPSMLRGGGLKGRGDRDADGSPEESS
jgi:predicted RND superfamily exporter protein